MVPETKRDMRRFDENSDSLKLPDRVSQGIAITGMLNPSLTQEWGNSANWGVGSELRY